MTNTISLQSAPKDFKAAVVVFLVALPLCLGIALASGAPLFSGIISGIIGGIVVGAISGSHTSVSGPAAGLTAVVASQLAALGGSFEAFLCAVFLAGIFQIILGGLSAGSIALETLLNLEAVDELDKKQRTSPPNRELIAQGCGNMCAGLLGGIPVTSVIIRSSVNVDTGAETKCSAVFHGILLFLAVVFFPFALNKIPLSCLAAILIVTGIKLANPKLFKQMWLGGRTEFIPFIVTVLAIVFTDLLSGILLGLAVSIAFILQNNLKQPIRKILEKHVGEDVLRVELPNQVSFLNRASVKRALRQVEDGGHILIDARSTRYIDPDVMDVIHEFQEKTAPAHNITVSMLGLADHYDLLDDKIQYVDFSSRDSQQQMSPQQALQVLLDGNERFRNGQMLTRNLGRQVEATSEGQHPIACILSCIDSRASAEVIFDMGIGDIFNVRVAGNVTSDKVLGSIEFACSKAGSKLVLVTGHSRCGAVTAAMQLIDSGKSALQATGCEHIDSIVTEISSATDKAMLQQYANSNDTEKSVIIDGIARCNVLHSVRRIREQSKVLREMEERGEIAIVGALYDVSRANVEIVN
ncbi:UNVERIFIED_CONTAM: hypothetical protein GTU68_048915 [Idotea baltica]|nr:hypothetical protein [Idotea baltica]